MGTLGIEPHIAYLKALPFVKGVTLRPAPHREIDALIEIRTPDGPFVLACEIKRTFLDRTLTNALIAAATRVVKIHKLRVLLMAPYIPRPTGDLLADAGVNFVDRYGNLNLILGMRYQALVMGKRRNDKWPRQQAVGPAAVQIILAYLVDERAANWPVRELAKIAGVSKTRAADVRRQLTGEGILQDAGARGYRITDRDILEQRWLTGYGELLRPRLVIGTYRAPNYDAQEVVMRFADTRGYRLGRWAVTGAAAAFALQRFYRGPHTPIFVEKEDGDLRRALRLLPDTTGPITLLRTFGPIVFWKTVGLIPVAHPWLIYAELLQDNEPRAREAAEKLRQELLERK